MNSGKYVFSQIVSFLDSNDFKKCVDRYDGNYKVKQFTCWNQLLCMIFGQLSNRDSLSDLLLCLKTQRSKLFHLGIGNSISKSNLAYANENRSWQIFSDYANLLIMQARDLAVENSDLDYTLASPVYAIDTTTIDLCLNIFWWAKFRKYKGAVKLHTVLDVKTEIPCFVHITDGKTHEVNILDKIIYETGGFYIMDRGFLDYQRLYHINEQDAYFVIRGKVNMKFKCVKSWKVDKETGVQCDQTIKLTNFYAEQEYPKSLRRIKYFDKETQKQFVFITNNFSLEPLQIAHLYKHRWKIELFFKWIKQHLKVKSFWGRVRSDSNYFYLLFFDCKMDKRQDLVSGKIRYSIIIFHFRYRFVLGI